MENQEFTEVHKFQKFTKVKEIVPQKKNRKKASRGE